MIDFLLDRTTVISLAVIGGVFSMLASWCSTRGTTSEKNIKLLNKAAYGFMAVSVILFIAAGLFSGESG